MANYFPRYTNILPIKIAICLGSLAIGAVFAFNYYGSPKAQRVGYQPDQPIPYDHELHVNQLGLDCRHCHSFAEKSGVANIPSANVCGNCHHEAKGGIASDSPRLAPLMDAIDNDKPIKWVRVHKAPDYVFFNHSAHLNRGISCVECHGQVNEMRVVFHAKPLSMAQCLDCHRNPEDALRPLEEVFNLNYKAKDYISENAGAKKMLEDYITENKLEDINLDKEQGAQKAMGLMLKDHWNVRPKESCFTCHR